MIVVDRSKPLCSDSLFYITVLFYRPTCTDLLGDIVGVALAAFETQVMHLTNMAPILLLRLKTQAPRCSVGSCLFSLTVMSYTSYRSGVLSCFLGQIGNCGGWEGMFYNSLEQLGCGKV